MKDTEKVCWVCGRSESEIVDLLDDDYPKVKEEEGWLSGNWHGINICPVCRDLISQHEAQPDWGEYLCDVFEEDILPLLSIKMVPSYEITFKRKK